MAGGTPPILRFLAEWSMERRMASGSPAAGAKAKDPIRILAGPELPDSALTDLSVEVVRVEDGASCDLRIICPGELAREGVRALRRHRLRWPDTPTVVVHAADAPTSLIRSSFRAGASDVIPLDALREELERAIGDLVRRQRAGRAQSEEAQMMASELGKHARDLEATLERLRESYDQTLNALVAALDLREKETAFHSQRVATYSVLVGLRLNLDLHELEQLYRGALLHDIGKIGTPDAILLKPGSFTEEEWEIMRRHAAVGGEILDQISFLRDASAVPHAHHEAWDGSGYPRGLRSEDIPLNARIFAVVDTYDAIRSKRPYKEAQPHERAIALIGRASGQRLDPSIAALFSEEPEATWSALEASLSGTITFQSCLTACRRVGAA